MRWKWRSFGVGVALGLLRCLLGGVKESVAASAESATSSLMTLPSIEPSTPENASQVEDSSASGQQQVAVVEMGAFEAAQLGYFRHPGSVSVILSVAYTVVFVVGIVGNSFVIAIVCKSPRMRTVTNYFIANLALADILVLLFCLPATLMSNLFIPYVLGLFVCKTVSYLQGVAVSASINTMLAVTMDRFLAICFPMDWHMSRRLARWAIACIWLFSLSVSLPWALYFTLVPYPLESGKTIQVCAEEWPSERMGTVYFVIANLILLYLFPLCVIILCYLGIWYKIERRNIPGDQPQGLKIELIMQKSKLKVIKMMMVVVIIFLLSWFPLYLISARFKLADEQSQWEEWLIEKLMPLAQWLGASNSCINPILYTFFNRKYKQGFIELLRYGFCCGRARRSSISGLPTRRSAGLCGSAERVPSGTLDNQDHSNNNNNNTTTTSRHFNGSASSSGRTYLSSRPNSGKLASNGTSRGSTGAGNQQLLAIRMDILGQESSSSCLTQVREGCTTQVNDGECAAGRRQWSDADRVVHSAISSSKRHTSWPISRVPKGGAMKRCLSYRSITEFALVSFGRRDKDEASGCVVGPNPASSSLILVLNNNNLACPRRKGSFAVREMSENQLIGYHFAEVAASSRSLAKLRLARRASLGGETTSLANNKHKRVMLDGRFSWSPNTSDANKLNPLPNKDDDDGDDDDDELADADGDLTSSHEASRAARSELKSSSDCRTSSSIAYLLPSPEHSQVAWNSSSRRREASELTYEACPGEQDEEQICQPCNSSSSSKSNLKLNLKCIPDEPEASGREMGTKSGLAARSPESCLNSSNILSSISKHSHEISLDLTAKNGTEIAKLANSVEAAQKQCKGESLCCFRESLMINSDRDRCVELKVKDPDRRARGGPWDFRERDSRLYLNKELPDSNITYKSAVIDDCESINSSSNFDWQRQLDSKQVSSNGNSLGEDEKESSKELKASNEGALIRGQKLQLEENCSRILLATSNDIHLIPVMATIGTGTS